MSIECSVSSGIELTVSSINVVDAAVLSKIVKRICQHFPTTQEVFSADELSKLQSSLSLEKEKLNEMLSSMSHVIQRAAFYLMKPPVFKDYLKSVGLNESASTLVSDAWAINAKAIIDKLKKESIFLLKVDSVESSIHYRLSSHFGSQVKIPIGLLHLNLTPDSSLKPASSLTLEFTQDELYAFYQTLETIQNQLDQVTA